MRAKIYITIEDGTSEEQLIAAGLSLESMRELYRRAFQSLLDATLARRGRADLRVEVEDNTKEDNQ